MTTQKTTPLTRGQKAAATRRANAAAKPTLPAAAAQVQGERLMDLLGELNAVSTALTVNVGAVEKVFCAVTVMIQGVEVGATYDGDDWSLHFRPSSS